MTGYDRFHAVLRNESCDILPRMPILMTLKARFAGFDYRSFATDYRVKADANIRCAKHFGVDVVDVMSDPYCETEGYGADIEYPHDDVPRCLHQPLASSKDLSQLLHPNPNRSARMVNTISTVRAYRDRVFEECSIHGWVEGPAAEAANLRGVQQYLMDLLLDPAWCAELMNICTSVAIDFASAQVASGADVIGVGDSICSQLPPDVYADLVVPMQRRLFESIRSAGGRVRLHICGDITHLLPSIKELPIDILDVDHLTDIGQAREALGSGFVLAGNLDPVADMLHGTPEGIRMKVRGIYDRIGNPMVVSAGCEIPRETPHENLRALCQSVAYRS